MKTTAKIITTTVLMVQWIIIVTFSQEPSAYRIDSVLKAALQLSPQEGIELISNEIKLQMLPSLNGTDMLKMNFTVGYLYQTWAMDSKFVDSSKLESALDFYGKASELDPENTEILNNMINVSKALGKKETSLKILDKAIEADYSGRTKYYINKGEVYYNSKDFLEAIESYKKALYSSTDKEMICWKIFNTYLKLRDRSNRIAGLLDFSEELLDKGMTDLARNGFLLAVNNSISGPYDESAEIACIGWANALSKKESISNNDVAELPDTARWPVKCNKEIHRVFSENIYPFKSYEWWTKNNFRKHILASLMLGLESEMLREGDVQKAVQMLELAREISPLFHVYQRDDELKNFFPIEMDIALELSRLYYRYPKLDSTGQKFQNLTNELFNEKALHYIKNDWEGIYKSHTLLGLIYAERGIWTSSWYAANAIFQLENAVKYHDKIIERNPEKFKPIPSIYQALAKGYKNTNQPFLKFESLVKAVRDYLDLDNLSASDSIIKMIEDFSGKTDDYSKMLNELEEITQLRLDIRNDNYNFVNSATKSLDSILKNDSFFSSTDFENNESFINRQKFKILADIGKKCSGNPSYAIPIFEAEALSFIEKESALGSYQDINRLNTIGERFKDNVTKEIKFEISHHPVENRDRNKTWSINSGDQQLNIQVGNDLLITAKIFETINIEQEPPIIEELNLIKVNRGNVDIPRNLLEMDIIYEEKVKQVSGVESVRTIDL